MAAEHVLTLYNASDNDGFGALTATPAVYVNFRRDVPKMERAAVIARELSERSFRSLPIDVSLLLTEDSEEILIVDLVVTDDPGEQFPLGWWQYFQGSTGAGLTAVKLTETFLQRTYRGEWFEGVEFRYDGLPLGPFDHINLSERIYRNETID